jgi:ribulose-phosphate 3-epimerase
MQDYRIAPSILSADFARLGEEVVRALEGGADFIHFDVMDNHFVPNLTVGPVVCEALRPHIKRQGERGLIDVHLMVSPVDRIVGDFARAGADIVSFHPEGSIHVHRTLSLIRNEGMMAGLVFNPATPLDYLDYVMDLVDVVLIMSVNPGFGGQAFIPSALDKIAATRLRLDEYEQRTGRRVLLEVDGGVKADNIASIARAGACTFVAGSAVFGAPDADGGYRGSIGALRAALAAS